MPHDEEAINIEIGIILLVIFLPACMLVIFSIMQKAGHKSSKTMSEENFSVIIPGIVIAIGTICASVSLAVILGFTFLSDELPHFIFYLIFGCFFWLGTYLILKTLTFKVSVKGKEIIVFSAFKRPYSFTFSEIVSVVRQVKKNQTRSERIVIRTAAGKKLIVESGEISYKRFVKKVRTEVKSEYLVGFE